MGPPGPLVAGAAYRGADRHCGAARCLAWRSSAKYVPDLRSHRNTMTIRPTAHSATLTIHVDGVTSPWEWILSTVRLSTTNRTVDRIRTPGRPRLVLRAMAS